MCIPQCVLWCQGGICHCNSHKRSNYWSNLRNSTLLGGLQTFNLTLSEIDEHLRHAGTVYRAPTSICTRSMKAVVACLIHLNPLEERLQLFKKEAFEQFSTFLRGQSLMEYGLNVQKHLIHE